MAIIQFPTAHTKSNTTLTGEGSFTSKQAGGNAGTREQRTSSGVHWHKISEPTASVHGLTNDTAVPVQTGCDDTTSCEAVNGNTIDMKALRANTRKLNAGLIAPATETVTLELANEHAAEPIKSMDDILRVSEYLIENKRYRDNMLFILGINFGMRVSDLLQLRFTHLITDGFVFRETFAILEQKTKNTRRVRKNRYITINDAVIDAVTLYLENTPDVKLSDYLFRCESNRCTANKPMHRNSVDRILKGIAEDLGLGNKMSTHTLRKTFAYHQMVMSNNDPRKLLLLQKIFGHSTAAQTLDYIGITGEEIEEAYRKLNLGSATKNYLIDSTILETETSVG